MCAQAHILCAMSDSSSLRVADADREALASRLQEKKYAPGEKVFSKDEKGTSMYVVLSGAVQIFLPPPPKEKDAPRVILKDSRTGEYFGELALFDDKPRSASVEATMDTVLLELTREDFAEHLGRSKTAALSILSEMAERLRVTNSLLSQRAATNAVKEIEENLTWGQRFADKIAELNGSWAFILFLLFLSFGWSLTNSVLAKTTFDPYPYQFYNLFLAVLVALQGPLIVMSQNRQTMKDRATAETDFRVNLKNEVGIESLQRDLAAFRAETTTRLEVLERMARAERVRAEVPVKMPGGPLTVKSPSDTT